MFDIIEIAKCLQLGALKAVSPEAPSYRLQSLKFVLPDISVSLPHMAYRKHLFRIWGRGLVGRSYFSLVPQ